MQVKIKEAKQNKVFQVESINSIRSIDILNHISLSIPKNTIVDITRMVIGPENVLISLPVSSSHNFTVKSWLALNRKEPSGV